MKDRPEVNSREEQTLPPSHKGKANGAHHVTFAESHMEHSTNNGSLVANGHPTKIAIMKTATDTPDQSRNNSSRTDNYVLALLPEQPQDICCSSSPGALDSAPSTPQSQSQPVLAPIIRLHRSRSTESHDNPFLADGELSKKADYILEHSTISRTEIKIEDPDEEKRGVVTEQIQKTASAPVNAASPGQRPNEINVRENGKMEEPLTPQSVEVEVGTANATQAEPQKAEQVKLKEDKKGCKCCVVM